jgi:glucose dehydrogenase
MELSNDRGCDFCPCNWCCADGTVFVGSLDNKVYALNGSTGGLRWSFQTGDDVLSSPAIAVDGTVYVGSNVYALNGSTGALQWNFATGGGVTSAPAIAADGTVYVGSANGQLFALNGSTGTVFWNLTISTAATSSPAIGVDGTLYIGFTTLYALWCALPPSQTLSNFDEERATNQQSVLGLS